jgi:hypothetical protein
MGLRPIGGLVAALCVAACAGTPTDTSQPVDRACTVADCFFERDVRDFEVIDQTTLIVYVGNQRCPFQIELRGTFCDLTFAPDISFNSPRDLETRPDAVLGTVGRSSSGLRICSGDLQIGVDGGVFTDDPTATQPNDRLGNPRSQCQISSIESMTDDELVELFVAHGVIAPPPPMGSGEIEVGEQDDEAADPTTPEENAPAAPAGEPTARVELP